MTNLITVIPSPYKNGVGYPTDPKEFAEHCLKVIRGSSPSYVPLEDIVPIDETTCQIRENKSSDKHVSDLKKAIAAVGQEDPGFLEQVRDGAGNVANIPIEGNNRKEALHQLYEEDPNWNPGNRTGKPEIRAYVLEEGFFPTDEYREAFQLWCNRKMLRLDMTPDRVLAVVGTWIEKGMFGDPATAAEGDIEKAAKKYVRDLFPTFSKKRTADSVVASSSKAKNKRRLTTNFTATAGQKHKASSRVVFGGEDRGSWIINPMTIKDTTSDFKKAVGEILIKREEAASDVDVNPKGLPIKCRMVAKTSNATNVDISSQRAAIRKAVSDINSYFKGLTGTDLIDELLFLPEKSNESREFKRNRFVP
jgi:hypothetical protein